MVKGEGGGDPARAGNEVCVGSTRLSLRAENWRNRGDGISRKQRVPVSFSRNKGSSFPKLSPCLCINHQHAGKYKSPDIRRFSTCVAPGGYGYPSWIF